MTEIKITTEVAPRIVETGYNHQYIEIPTEGWKFGKRLRTAITILTGGDVIIRHPHLQHVDLRSPKMK